MGITYNEFIKNHVGKAMDYDGCAGCQCVDLAKYYLDEVFEIKAGAWGDAHSYYDEWTTYTDLLQKNFTRIANTPDFVPKKGDIAVWKPSLSAGGWGHIAIATGEGDTSYFYSYDCNWTGKHDPCTKIKHNYNHFYGVLRAKDQTKITGETKTAELKTLDATGFKNGDKSDGVLAYKELLIIAKDLGIISQNVKEDRGFGDGTKKATNQILKTLGYKQTGIAGTKLIKKLSKKIRTKM